MYNPRRFTNEESSCMPNNETIANWMKTKVFTIQSGAPLTDAVALMVGRKFGTLPVLDSEGRHIGTLSLSDIIHRFLPDFVSLLDNIDFVIDFGALTLPSEEESRAELARPVDDLMEEPVSVEQDCSLARALSVMEKHELVDLPVVQDGRVIGIASWVDVGRAFLTATLKLPARD